MEKSIAFFDFDGTITRKDTMLELVKYVKGDLNFYKGMLFISPWLVGLKLGLVKNSDAKEKLLTFFFKGTSVDEFNSACTRFSEEIIPGLIRPDAYKAIMDHKQEGHEIVVVSASAENWISPWCEKNNLKYLATKLEVKNNLITGKLAGENCNGIEKVNRIKQMLDPADYKFIFCYGDSSGDKEMMNIATNPFFKIFKG